MTKGKFKKKKVYFTQVSNHVARDTNLSLRAKGLYTLIQSHITKEDFDLYKGYLMKQCTEGRDAFQKAWTELINAGYLVQERLKDKKGVFYYEYDLLEIAQPKEKKEKKKKRKAPKTKGSEGNDPHTENPHTENPYTENPYTENQYGIIIEEKNNIIQNNTIYNNKSSSSNVKKKNSKKVSKTNEEEDDNVSYILNKCIESNISITRDELQTLFGLYDGIKILRAIEKAINANKGKKIRSGYNYIATILDNDSKSKITNITVNKEKTTGFNNFTGRQRTAEEYNSLELQLLGWDKED